MSSNSTDTTATACPPCAASIRLAREIHENIAAVGEVAIVFHDDPDICAGGGCQCSHGAIDGTAK